MNPLMVVDVQPGYSSAIMPWMPGAILQAMRQTDEDVPILIVSVNEELTGDTPASIEMFWQDHGMDDELFSRVTFLEKPYAFFRGWMDNGVDEDEIVATVQTLRKHRVGDSRNLDSSLLAEIAPHGHTLASPLYLPWELEEQRAYRQPAWRLCGGARDECLKEVELWLASMCIGFERLDHLVYG